MRAITASTYGGPEVLEIAEVDDPKLGPDSVLVRVGAAGINPVDYKILRGYLDGAFETTFPMVPGWDVAGVVEAVGPAVTHVHVGQTVFGYARKDWIGAGTWAERVAVPARGVAPAPESVDVAEAGVIPLAGLTAYQGLVHQLVVGQPDTVLIHGASGGVGTFACQIAVARGARVIGTASQASHAHLESLGAQPIAYGEGLVERVRNLAPNGVDAVFDLVGGEALETTSEVLRSPGRVSSVAAADTPRRYGGHYLFVRPDADDLAALGRLVDAGEVKVVIADRWPLEQVADAVTAAEAGGIRGKLVLDIG